MGPTPDTPADSAQPAEADPWDDMETHFEEMYYGDVLGNCHVHQISSKHYQNHCLSSNLSEGDSTGLRAYSGSHVIVRFLVKNGYLTEGLDLVEMGCGVGVVGLLGTMLSPPRLLVLTDGEMRAQAIIDQNITVAQAQIGSRTIYHSHVLKWGNAIDTEEVLELCRSTVDSTTRSGFFDVVLGSELMYFNTDVGEIVDTVLSLTNKTGLFVHAHVFRARGQELSIIKLFGEHSWATLEVPCTEYITKEELDQHVEWRRVRMLISGPVASIAVLAAAHPAWLVFQEEITYEYSDDEDADMMNIFA